MTLWRQSQHVCCMCMRCCMFLESQCLSNTDRISSHKKLLESTVVAITVTVVLCRTRILQDIDRFIHPEQVINRVVFCLDDIVLDEGCSYTMENSRLSNFDEQKFAHFLCTRPWSHHPNWLTQLASGAVVTQLASCVELSRVGRCDQCKNSTHFHI